MFMRGWNRAEAAFRLSYHEGPKIREGRDL
jgi:hypothetical protein